MWSLWSLLGSLLPRSMYSINSQPLRGDLGQKPKKPSATPWGEGGSVAGGSTAAPAAPAHVRDFADPGFGLAGPHGECPVRQSSQQIKYPVCYLCLSLCQVEQPLCALKAAPCFGVILAQSFPQQRDGRTRLGAWFCFSSCQSQSLCFG